ncbi:helix-turn-helix domain-containing protein [Sanguibacter sp. Leaf3]|uniref:helix-turn-helix domain-containing protein n=1 Tax=Sanguibacter sp. Leaf3 TaxID=1736209 RepID=UPI0006F7B02F|nr:hypothetical protein ASG53_11925 [Sanguibacter sp. Leaf3]
MAAILRQHHETVLRGLRAGRIPGVKLGRWLTRREDLDAMLADTQWSRNRQRHSAPTEPTPVRAQASGRRPSF